MPGYIQGPVSPDIQKVYLARCREYYLQLQNSVAEYAKKIGEALTAIDKAEKELESRKPAETEKKAKS
jgi:hypothetical protein